MSDETLPLIDMRDYGPPLYVDCIVSIEASGPLSQIVLAHRQNDEGRPCNVVVGRLIIPTQMLARMARQLTDPSLLKEPRPAVILQ
jgi:hypothetical protein